MKRINRAGRMGGFLLLWSSQAVSALGTAMTEYALIVWAYGQNGTASDVARLTLCTFLPTILFRFAGGAIADRLDKKRIMLIADAFAACGTCAILLLDRAGLLRMWQLYLINILLSMMNAVQVPASFVATSLLVPKESYAKAGGLQGISDAAVSILAPALGAVLLSLGGLKAVLLCDLCTFFLAFLVLLLLIRIPEAERTEHEREGSLWKTLTEGFRFLKEDRVLMNLILFLTVMNFLAKIGSDGMIAPFVLGKTGDDQQVLGAVQSSVAFGLLAGSLLVTKMKPVKDRLRMIFLTTATVFTGDLFLSFTDRAWVWCTVSFGVYALAAVMNANLTVWVRERVPVSMQGRAFSAKDTLQNCSIPLGLFLGACSRTMCSSPICEGIGEY